MLVFNVKLNKNKFFRIICVIIAVLIALIVFLSLSKIANKVKLNKFNSDDTLLEIKSNNYTNFLKDCHENMNKYIGKKIKISGYVYRMPDFNDNEFVIARTMLDMKNSTAVVVGLLANYENVNDLKDNVWIECEGVIEKGDYHGDIPILKVNRCSKIAIPEDEFVSSPSD